MNDAVHTLSRILRDGKHMVFFGGAGVSTESAIPDFRSASGLYRQRGKDTVSRAPEEILHRDFFYRHPDLFYDYYFAHMVYPDAKPNAAHTALAELERQGRLAAVITQNIDGLHQAAGSRRVIELHGSVHRNSCTGCGGDYTLADLLTQAPGVPRCAACGGLIKPDVVLYGEALPDNAVDDALRQIAQADVLMVGGTSLSVYPAAGLLHYFRGDTLVLINRDETPYDGQAQLVIREKIGAVLSACMTHMKTDSCSDGKAHLKTDSCSDGKADAGADV